MKTNGPQQFQINMKPLHFKELQSRCFKLPCNLFKCLAIPVVRNFLLSNIHVRYFGTLSRKLQYEDKSYYYYLTCLPPSWSLLVIFSFSRLYFGELPLEKYLKQLFLLFNVIVFSLPPIYYLSLFFRYWIFPEIELPFCFLICPF